MARARLEAIFLDNFTPREVDLLNGEESRLIIIIVVVLLITHLLRVTVRHGIFVLSLLILLVCLISVHFLVFLVIVVIVMLRQILRTHILFILRLKLVLSRENVVSASLLL